MRWAGHLERLDQRVMATLNDGLASYASAAGTPVASGVTVIVERNLERVGPDGMFIAIPLAITWRKSELADAQRGGRFTVGAASYIVEQTVSDDGNLITAACFEP
jgi:hypothetical protein